MKYSGHTVFDIIVRFSDAVLLNETHALCGVSCLIGVTEALPKGTKPKLVVTG